MHQKKDYDSKKVIAHSINTTALAHAFFNDLLNRGKISTRYLHQKYTLLNKSQVLKAWKQLKNIYKNQIKVVLDNEFATSETIYLKKQTQAERYELEEIQGMLRHQHQLLVELNQRLRGVKSRALVLMIHKHTEDLMRIFNRKQLSHNENTFVMEDFKYSNY